LVLIQDSLQSNPVYFSRRRRQPAAQTRLPDWVWGAGLGVLALIFVGGFFLVSGVLGGGGSGGCDQALSPLGTSTVDEETFNFVDEALTRTISSLQNGDRDGAFANFYGPPHNFTHNVDPPLREIDEDAAKTLCGHVLDIEASLESGSLAQARGDAENVQEDLRDAAEILGFPRPGP
jgi:hypothetical protein